MTTTTEHTDVSATRTVSEVARESGIAASAVRFYEKYGVITAVRTRSNQRRFNDSAACRIKVAKLAQRVGMTVREIADVFTDLPATPGPDDWGRVATVLVEHAQARVEQIDHTYLTHQLARRD